MPRRTKELRCFCRGEPLLAMYGVDAQGQMFVHVRVYKQNRIYGEMVVNGVGSITKIKCRNCLRWYTIKFKGPNAELVEDSAPEVDASNDEAMVLDAPRYQ